MKLALLGVGNAGTRIVDKLIEAEKRTKRPLTNGQVLAFNTTPSAFETTEYIDEDRQFVVGDIHPDVVQPDDIADGDDESDADTDDDTDGEPAQREGVGGDPELGVSVARDDLPEIRRALDLIEDTEVDAAMLVTGLGGGTGCGVGAVLLEELKSIYEIPVYVLGVLPTSKESDQRAWTAARAIRTFVPMADSVIPVDNESWIDRHGNTEDYGTLNRAIATRIVSVFGAGEHDGQVLSELQMDPNDVRRVLEIGGLATVGYAKTELKVVSESWLTRLRRLLGLSVPEPEAQTDAVSIKDLVQRAVESALTLPCDVESADRVLLVLAGPPEELSRKGFEAGRYLLEDETGTVEVLAGDEPLPNASRITATILLSNVTDVPRIEALQKRAVSYQQELLNGPQNETPAAIDDEDPGEDETEDPSTDDTVETETTESDDQATDDSDTHEDETEDQSSDDSDADEDESDEQTTEDSDTDEDESEDQSSDDSDADEDETHDQSSDDSDSQEDEADDQATDDEDTEPVAEAVEDGADGGADQGAADADDHGFEFDEKQTVEAEQANSDTEPSADPDDADDSAPDTELQGDTESEPNATDTDSEPNTTDTDSEPNTTDTDSEPNATDTDSEPNTTDTDSEPNTTDTDSEPNATDTDSEPNTTDTDSEPNITDPFKGGSAAGDEGPGQ